MTDKMRMALRILEFLLRKVGFHSLTFLALVSLGRVTLQGEEIVEKKLFLISSNK